jgi:hypothetical protein
MTRHAEIWDWLVGSWSGSGCGSYPGIEPFRYTERLVIAREDDWNMLSVLQRTWLERDGSTERALHLESGLIQLRDDGSLLYCCGQDSGRTEVMAGTITLAEDALRIDWLTTAHSNDARLLRMGRTWWIEGTCLRYEAFLSTVRTPEYRKHLEATLQRQAAP